MVPSSYRTRTTSNPNVQCNTRTMLCYLLCCKKYCLYPFACSPPPGLPVVHSPPFIYTIYITYISTFHLQILRYDLVVSEASVVLIILCLLVERQHSERKIIFMDLLLFFRKFVTLFRETGFASSHCSSVYEYLQ